MKKLFYVLMTCVLMAAMLLAGCAAPGSDVPGDANTGGQDSAAPAETPEEGEQFKIVLIAKTEGHVWFDDMRLGVNELNEELPDAEVTQIAPEGSDPAKQVAMMEDMIASGVDAIVVVPNDPESLIPAIKRAKEKGIIVITHEAQAIADAVDYDMEAFDNEAFGALYGEKLAEAMGGKGKYCGVVGALTMETHNVWYNAAVNFIKENYPEMELVQEQPFEDKIDNSVAYDVAKQVLRAYPDLGGYLTMTVESTASMSLLLKENNNTNVKVSGLAMPSSVGEFIKEGWCANGQVWRPADAGYVACNIAYKLLKGEEMKDGVDLGKEGYESIKIVDKVIYGDAPLVLTAENVDNFPF